MYDIQEPPEGRRSLGSTFRRFLRKLVLPTGHSETSGPVIVLNGDTGVITVIGTNGAKITIDPNAAGLPYPQITFTSVDGTNDSWLNAVSTVANPGFSDIGLSSGKFTPADAIQRRTRLYLADGGSAAGFFEVIKESDQTRRGGYLTIFKDGSFLGWGDGTSDQYVTVQSTGFSTNTLTGFAINGDAVSGQVKYIFEFGPAANDTTTSGSMVNMKNGAGGNATVNFVKRFTATAIQVQMHASFFSTTAEAGSDFGVLINGTDYLVASLAVANGSLGVRQQASGVVRVAGGLAAGTYSVQARWRRINAAGTLTRSTDDLMTIAIREVDAN